MNRALTRLPGTPNRRFLFAAVGMGLAIVWLTLAAGLSSTRAPWSSEAWTAIPALNLVNHGSMYTSVLESKNTWLQGIDRHTYWMMPLHLLTQAVWYKIVGFSLFKQRLLSVLFAALLLVSWSTIVARLTGSSAAAFAFCAIAAFESNFLHGAANGRMDMMCAALGSSAIAVWLKLRLNAPRSALLLSNALAAAAVFTHPCGILFAAVLLYMNVSLTGWRPQVGNVLLSSIPYATGAAVWGAYIIAAPADFRSQLLGNVSGFAGEYLQRTRIGELASPWRAIASEIKLRYATSFGFDDIHSQAGSWNALWFSIVGAGAGATMLIPELRARPGVRVLLFSGLLMFLLMTFFEGMKFPHYIIHPLPFLVALAASTWGWLWTRYQRMRLALVACLCVLVLPQVRLARGAIIFDALRHDLVPTVEYLRANTRFGAWIIGPAELGYELGFESRLRDDVRLGYYSGLRPQFIVTPAWYRLWFQAAAARDPQLHAYMSELLGAHYRPVFGSGEYIIYRKIAQ